MSISFKPDVSTLQIVEVDVSTSQKGGSMTDLSLIAEQEWSEARRRAVVLRPLLEFTHCPRNKAHEAAVELGAYSSEICHPFHGKAAT
ncbi:hypothetical protein A1359_20255 [Methylomonas lenta]|uniref:Uncharacterized protein n=1 Tax=Methylomonas lenta TaxID=980561 RepID=A0A177NS44_9GAMM|nr:hypothetical protein [Methylomonas lenta]OAI20876.1 hypothetical protein A1359_20255 [Methylomonas lenta]